MNVSGKSTETGKKKKIKAKRKSSKDRLAAKKNSPPKLFKTSSSKTASPVKLHNDDEEIHKALESYMKKEMDKSKEKDRKKDDVSPGASTEKSKKLKTKKAAKSSK